MFVKVLVDSWPTILEMEHQYMADVTFPPNRDVTCKHSISFLICPTLYILYLFQNYPIFLHETNCLDTIFIIIYGVFSNILNIFNKLHFSHIGWFWKRMKTYFEQFAQCIIWDMIWNLQCICLLYIIKEFYSWLKHYWNVFWNISQFLESWNLGFTGI